MGIVHDSCRDQCNTPGAASNPNGRAQNWQLGYDNTVKPVMRVHLLGCFNCIFV